MLLVLLLLPLLAAADVVVLKSGKKFHGKVVSEEPEVVLNIFNSPFPEMVLGVEKFPKGRVKRIVRTIPSPPQEFQLKIKTADTARGCIELAGWCETHKLKEERRVALEKALRIDPKNEVARKALGAKAPKGNWQEQVALARRYLDAEDDAARAEALGEIARDRHFPFRVTYMRRALRSKGQRKGYQKDRPVAMLADKLLANARYTLVVPESYDPLMPTPLVIGLHGGGAGGADGKLVVGSGHSAMNFYRGHCERLGWICACPTALRAGWRNKPNNELIDALLDELRALYNIDENRIYLTGHSMGGGGSWSQGARLPETWACVAPTASFGVHGIDKFKKTKTPFYVYHSDNDPRTGVGGVRPRMKSLPGSGTDFVYTELPGKGHGLPGAVLSDIFRYFEVRLLARGPGRFKTQVRPQSSFLRKVSRDEKKYLPRLLSGATPAEDPLGKLLKKLMTGGGVAEHVVPELIRHKDPKTSARVAKIMLKPASTPDVRRFAARVLGGRKAAKQIKALGRVLLIETESNALYEFLEALEEIGDPAAGEHLLRFLKKRHAYMVQRARGTQLDHSDWITIIPPMAKACSLIGSFLPEKGAASITKNVLEGVFLGGTTVIYDSQNQRPLPTGRALAAAACDALGKLGGTDAIPALEKLAKMPASRVTTVRKRGPAAIMSDWAKDPRIAAHISEALAELKG